MILPRYTTYECNKLIDLMREDKRNKIKSVYSYLNTTHYAKERCRRGEKNMAINVWERQTREGQNRLKIRFLLVCLCSSLYKGSVLSVQAIMMILAH